MDQATVAAETHQPSGCGRQRGEPGIGGRCWMSLVVGVWPDVTVDATGSCREHTSC